MSFSSASGSGPPAFEGRSWQAMTVIPWIRIGWRSRYSTATWAFPSGVR